MFRYVSVALLTLALSAFNVQYLDAQAITAKIVGTVTDQTAATVPGATVTITNQATNVVRSEATSEVGNYEFSFLPIGSYTLSVESSGFQKAQVTDIALDVDQVARVDVSLTLGEVT